MTCDFSPKHYREILETAVGSGYRFIGFDDLEALEPGQRACLLRHDVDYVPEWALRLGEIENKLGIRATYFFQVCAKTYNLRETPVYETVQRLRDLGHTIGLHFDLTWKPDARWEEVPELCRKDKAILKAIAGTEPCDIVSFHNPHRFAKLILDQDVPGIRHTYEKKYFSQIKYLSDSQGWYEGCMCHIFRKKEYPVIQLLTHADYWPESTTGVFVDDMARLVKFRSDQLLQYMVAFHPVCKKNEARLRAAHSELFRA